jgi:hypothetical protein
MTDLNTIGTIASIVSFILAIVFWRLADRQADRAERTLNEIKDKMMSWQNEINTAAINLIQSRPEVIAQRVALEEANSNSAFMERVAGIIESITNEADEKSSVYKIDMLKELLAHQRATVLGSEQIKANVIATQHSR